MKNKHVICFDFDDTLVFTSQLAPYRATRQGMSFVAANPEKVQTSECLPGLSLLFNKLINTERVGVAILTNSSENVARTILKKHKFEVDNINVYANQHKPFAKGFEDKLIATKYPRDRIVLIGDSNIDLLTSQRLGLHSILVGWGGFVKKSIKNGISICPSKIASNLKELQHSIDQFLHDKHNVKTPKIIENIVRVQCPEKRCAEETEITTHSLGSYFPTGHEYFYCSNSNEILRFKNIKNFSIEELQQGALNQYFYNGEIKSTGTMIHYFDFFKDKLVKKVESLNLNGDILFIAAPNSLPEVCYKSDVNQMMVNFLNWHFNGDQFKKFERLVYRAYPKPEAHLGGDRNNVIQYQTLGVHCCCHYMHHFKIIIIFDDITTTGSQLVAIQTIIRNCGFKGNIIGLTLGATSM